MWSLAKEGLFLLLAFLDAEFTKRKLSEYGVETELNPAIRALCRLFGIARGVDIGVALPTFALAYVGWFHPEVLAFLLGVRAFLFILQCRSRQSGD
jgi:hypothetical protein